MDVFSMQGNKIDQVLQNKLLKQNLSVNEPSHFDGEINRSI